MQQGECEKCSGRGEYHGRNCIVRRYIFEGNETREGVSKSEAMHSAILALKSVLNRDKSDGMSCQIIPFGKTKGLKMGSLSQDATSLGLDLERLKEPFREDEIEFRVSQSGETNGRIWVRCVCYIESRAIMNRLDKVCGAGNWRVSYEFVGDRGVICNLSILINGQWITKQDGAEMTEVEPLKGGLSSALKRAGSVWGMGRYLYSIEEDFVPQQNIFDKKVPGSIKGKTKTGKTFYWLPPKLPAWALPHGEQLSQTAQAITQAIQKSNPPNITSPIPGPVKRPSEAQMKRLWAIANSKNINDSDLHLILRGMTGHTSLEDLTAAEYTPLCDSILNGDCMKYLEITKKNGDDTIETVAIDLPEIERDETDHDVPWAKYRRKINQ